jgi:hypothetical protein
MTPLPPSEQLLEAASLEKDRLGQQAAHLTTLYEATRRRLAEIERSLAVVEERHELLNRLSNAPGPTAAAPPISGASSAEGHDDLPEAGDGGREVLRGPSIRKTAVRVLVADSLDKPDAIHYREWFTKLVDAGYDIAGKDPLAVFLSQITRSPAVMKSKLPGVYGLDWGAADRVREDLAGLHRALLEISTITTTRPADLAHIRSRRAELTAQISQRERALEEILEVLPLNAAPPPPTTESA